jgi:hypothetical protein
MDLGKECGGMKEAFAEPLTVQTKPTSAIEYKIRPFMQLPSFFSSAGLPPVKADPCKTTMWK